MPTGTEQIFIALLSTIDKIKITLSNRAVDIADRIIQFGRFHGSDIGLQIIVESIGQMFSVDSMNADALNGIGVSTNFFGKSIFRNVI